jgi:hypothetical protein
MKLNRTTLKKLIVETIQEAKPSEYESDPYLDDPEHVSLRSTERTYEDPTGPVPEEEMSLQNIADIFVEEGEKLRKRIKAYDEMPKAKISVMSQEQFKTALDDMDRVQKEIEEIKQMLDNLVKREERGEDQ